HALSPSPNHTPSSSVGESPGAHRHLPSFPTRRSSDLAERESAAGSGAVARRAHGAERFRFLPRRGSDHGRGSCCRAAHRHPGSVDRKSTRLNSSHVKISYAVFCLKKKKKIV